MKNSFFNPKKLDEKVVFQDLNKEILGDQGVFYAGNLLRRAAEKWPDKVALICEEKNVTFKEVYLRSLLLSKKLVAAGVSARDHVLLYMENSIEFYISYFAVWQLGAVVIPLNTFLHEKELSYVIKDAQPKVIIASESLKKKINGLVEQDYLEALPTIFTQNDINWEMPVTNRHLLQVKDEVKTTELGTDELCLLLYTSGTSGRPKGVMLSSKNIITNVIQGFARFKMVGLTSGERFFCVLPLFHVFAQNACLWLPMMTGGTVLCQKLTVSLFLRALKRNQLFSLASQHCTDYFV